MRLGTAFNGVFLVAACGAFGGELQAANGDDEEGRCGGLSGVGLSWRQQASEEAGGTLNNICEIPLARGFEEAAPPYRLRLFEWLACGMDVVWDKRA